MSKLTIFLLFDTFNSHKETLYRSFKDALPATAQCAIFFHHYRRKLFENLIMDNLGKYTHFMIIPHFEKDIRRILSKIPADKLIVLDQRIKKLRPEVSAIYQPFEKDTLRALRI